MADPRKLMLRYQGGDAGAFRELYALAAPRLLGYLMKMTRNRAIAEDLLQQTFLKIHRARGAYVSGADPIPWFFAIAHRTFIDEVRRGKRAIVQSTGDEVPDLPATLAGGPAGSDDERVDPELAREALAALGELPDQQREAVVLTKLEGLSVAEAADVAGTTVGAMKVRAHRGYEALRRLLAGRGKKRGVA
jgi:RNA polymerase sigma-70 factor (ECF subfamily)